MSTTTTERLTRTQYDRETPDRDVLRERPSSRTIALLLLGVVGLLVLLAVLATVRISFRPYRGC